MEPQSWALAVVICSVVCCVTELLITNTRLEKTVNSVLGVFMIGVMILPLNNIVSDIAGIDIAVPENAEEFREISEQRETMLKKELSLLVNKTLKNKGIEPLKTKIDMDIDDESGISIIKAEITLKKADSYKVQKVKNILKNDLSIDAKVITE